MSVNLADKKIADESSTNEDVSDPEKDRELRNAYALEIQAHSAFLMLNGSQAKEHVENHYRRMKEKKDIILSREASGAKKLFLYVLRPRSEGEGYAMTFTTKNGNGQKITLHKALWLTPKGFSCMEFYNPIENLDYKLFFQKVNEMVERIIAEEVYRDDLLNKVLRFLNSFKTGNQYWILLSNSKFSNTKISSRYFAVCPWQIEVKAYCEELNKDLNELITEIKLLLDQLNFDLSFIQEFTTETSLSFNCKSFEPKQGPCFELNARSLHQLLFIRERYRQLFFKFIADEIKKVIECLPLANLVMEYFHEPESHLYDDVSEKIPSYFKKFSPSSRKPHFYHDTGCYSLEYTQGVKANDVIGGCDQRIPNHYIVDDALFLSKEYFSKKGQLTLEKGLVSEKGMLSENGMELQQKATLESFKPYFDTLLNTAKQKVAKKDMVRVLHKSLYSL